MTVPEELKTLIGKIREPVIHRVECGDIMRIADAVEDRNPLYLDAEYAKQSSYGTIIAPPGFFGWPVKGPLFPRDGDPLQETIDAFRRNGYPHLLDAGDECEFYVPVRAGDVLVECARVTNILEKEGKTGPMLLFLWEDTFHNQNGDLVAKIVSTWFCLPPRR